MDIKESKTLNKLKIIIARVENFPTSFWFWLISFVSIVLIRVLVENWTSNMIDKSADYFFHHIYYTFIFFLLAYLIFLGFLSISLKTSISKISNIMLWGYLMIIFPPIIDYFLFKDDFYLSFYGIYGISEMVKRFFTFFGDNPNFGVTYGVRVEIALTILFVFIYGYIKTTKWIRSLGLAIIAYVILFFLATFPSWTTILVKGFKEGFLNVSDVDIVGIFFSPAHIFSKNIGSFTNALSIKLSLIYSLVLVVIVFFGLFFSYRKKLLVFLKNIRPVQIIYHLGLFIIGIGIGYRFTEVTWDIINLFNAISFINVIIAIVFTWMTSVIINDISDKKIDAISNKKRPLILESFSKNEYVTIGVILFIFSVMFAAVVNVKIAMLLVVYQALAWMYSVYPFRFKRIPILATFVSALASLMILFSGSILASPDGNIAHIPVQIIWLIVIAFTLSLPIKDLKDIAGDKKDNVMTIPVIFGEYWGKIIIGSSIFISYILSVLFLHEARLLFSAILFGGISFWIVTLSGENKKITHRNVIWWIMGLVFIYGLILIRYI